MRAVTGPRAPSCYERYWGDGDGGGDGKGNGRGNEVYGHWEGRGEGW